MLKGGDKGAAFTDVKEATVKIKRYNHPSNEKIVFWDFPGVGTKNYKQEEYLREMKLNKYDFFILVSSERFSENVGWLAGEIRKMDKRFFFVRTKVDNEIRAEKRSKKIHPEHRKKS
jgi:GTPase Era involved in 16S rRNA processing